MQNFVNDSCHLHYVDKKEEPTNINNKSQVESAGETDINSFIDLHFWNKLFHRSGINFWKLERKLLRKLRLSQLKSSVYNKVDTLDNKPVTKYL